MKMYSDNSIFFKVIFAGALVQAINLIFDRSLGILGSQGTLSPVLGVVDMYLLAPTLLFIFSFILAKKYSKFSLVQYKFLTLGGQVFLGYLLAFNLFEIINQRAIVYYFPGTLSLIAPVFAAYFGGKINSSSNKRK